MIKFHYRKESSRMSGSVIRPVADVIFEYKKQEVELAMYIDSGADMTMIPLEAGKALGFKQEARDEIFEIQGVSGSGVPYILKKADIRLDSEKFEIRLAWALIEEVPFLLGRMDIFPKFKITFDEKKEVIVFNK